jgi:hypothetical protein
MPKQSKDDPQRLHQQVIRIRGKNTTVPAVWVSGQEVICTGKYLRMARLFDDELAEGEPVADPAQFATELRASALSADVFTFPQKPGSGERHRAFYHENDNWAAIPIHGFEQWWEHLPQESRRNVRRAAKRGVVVKEVPFEEELVRGIKRIYDETPVRQGRHFWHYGKDLDAIRLENSTYLQRSWFLGAYFEGELIGFLKVIMADHVGTVIQVLSMEAHRDKRPTNALLSQAVRSCAERGVSLLVYGNYSYGKKGADSLTEFKRRNGFEKLTVPRYYVPLTLKGRIALKLGLHHGLSNIIPRPVAKFLLAARAAALRLTMRSTPPDSDASADAKTT